MSEPEALVARITITPENLERWLDSAIPSLRTWGDDWQTWWDARRAHMYSPSATWDAEASDRPGTVRNVLDRLFARSDFPGATFAQTWYDAPTNVWRFLAIEVSQNYPQMIGLLAPFRAAERFGACDEKDYAAFTSFFYDGHARRSGAAVGFSAGRSIMLLDEKLPKRVAGDITQQFHQAEEDRIILPYRYPDGTPPDGNPQVSQGE